jgi:chromosomal replication initiator protein
LNFTDGADVVDPLAEIPLPGRICRLPPPGVAGTSATAALPSFVAGPENRLAAGAFRELLSAGCGRPAEDARARRLAPAVVALFGPGGTGKTHLAHGLVRYWQGQHGAAAAEYMPAGDFRRQLAAAIRDNAIVEFRRRVRQRMLLALDDLQQLPNDEYLLQELRYTFDSLEESAGTLLVTSNRPASTLANLPADVRSRLSAGLMVQLAPPGLAARLRIIRQLSSSLGRPLEESAARQLAAGVTGTASDLIGALFEFFRSPSVNGRSDAAHAEQLVAARQRRPALRDIVAAVARHTRVPQKQLKSDSRKRSIVFARAVAVYLARELAAASYHDIGRALGGRDHTTIMHNYRVIDHQRLRDAATQQTLEELRRILISG